MFVFMHQGLFLRVLSCILNEEQTCEEIDEVTVPGVLLAMNIADIFTNIYLPTI
ncbi:hypothetical protein SATMO3_09700 [Sporomusa aerivorans]